MDKTAPRPAPHVPTDEKMKEFSLRAVLFGLVLGFLFAIGNAYLGLKVGLTISASIPAAVISMALLRTFSKKATILENNMVQTIASAGEAVATGTIFTIPALLFLGAAPSIDRTFFICIVGGLFGVLLMVPLRHPLIVEEHKTFPYPEGRACAEILKAKASRGGQAMLCIWGVIIGEAYKILVGIFNLWDETISWRPYKAWLVSVDTTPALLGIGFVIGHRYSFVMLAGGALTWWIIIPTIAAFDPALTALFPTDVGPTGLVATNVWANYVRYIGTGTLAVGGLVALLRLFPRLSRAIISHAKEMAVDLFRPHTKQRIDRDLSFWWVAGGLLACLVLLVVLPQIHLNFMAIALVILLGIFFIILTSVTTGLIGVSSSPVSGMIICILLVTSLIFLAIGWTDRIYLIMAMTVGAVLGVAVAVAGDTSQDFKTGALLGATPRSQQIGMIIGLIIPSITIGWALRFLNETYTFGSDALPAPQATLMYLVVRGIMREELPLYLLIVGIILGLVIELIGVRSLPFALGIFLPLSTTVAIAIGGALHYVATHKVKDDRMRDQGILVGSGLIAGDAVTGVIVAILAVTGVISYGKEAYFPQEWVSLVGYLVVVALFTFFTLRHPKSKR